MSNPDQQPETRVRTEEIPKSIAMRLAKAAYEAALAWAQSQERASLDSESKEPSQND